MTYGRVSDRLVPASITSRAGQITVGLRSPERWEGRGKARHPRDGLFLMTGSASERVGPPVRVPGTRRRDVGPLLVAATRSRRVVLAWQRGGGDRPRPLWDPRRQGIWLRRGSWNPQTALWSWGKRR